MYIVHTCMHDAYMSNIPKYTSYADQHFVASGYGPWGISYQQKTRTSQVTGNQRLEMCQGVRRNRSDSDEGKQRSKKATAKRKTSRIWDALSTSICLSKGTRRYGSMFPFFMCLKERD